MKVLFEQSVVAHDPIKRSINQQRVGTQLFITQVQEDAKPLPGAFDEFEASVHTNHVKPAPDKFMTEPALATAHIEHSTRQLVPNREPNRLIRPSYATGNPVPANRLRPRRRIAVPTPHNRIVVLQLFALNSWFVAAEWAGHGVRNEPRTWAVAGMCSPYEGVASMTITCLS
jgi:hypothetical protein